MAQKTPRPPGRTTTMRTKKQPLAKHLNGLDPDEYRFIDEYLIDFNGQEAMIRAGITENRHSASTMAAKYLARPLVAEEIARRMKKMSEKTGISAERVLMEAWGIVTADVNDLVEFRRTCCRHCYGIDYGYQRTVAEFNREKRAWLEKRNKALAKGADPLELEDFDEQGGIGYDARRPPNPDCQECFGEGIGNAHFKDTRDLTPEARALYAGVKQTKDGYQMLLIDKNPSMEKLFKHFGLYEKDNKQKSEGLEALVAMVHSRAGKLPIKE